MSNLAELFTLPNLAALVSLASLEIVLGIDNIVMLAVITGRLPAEQQSRMRRIGLAAAMIQRILLLFAISWVIKLTEPLFSILGRDVSGRDLILICGGLFLITKATFEIHSTIEGDGHEADKKPTKQPHVAAVLTQIMLLDAVFSLDSVITAVGMVDQIAIMVAAVVIAIAVMLIFADGVSSFISKHPTVKMLALSFLMLIGIMLVADGTGHHIERAYIYAAMGFSIVVETLNFRLRRKSST